MKASEVIEKVFTFGSDFDYVKTCDTLKCGSPDKEVKKVAVTMNPTVDSIREAQQWGADMMITHEPLYYNHWDDHSDESLETEKRAFLESTGMTVYRFHDHPHRNKPDMIAMGEYKFLGLDGKIIHPDIFALTRVELNTPITPLELAKRIEDKLGIKYVRIAGVRDEECTHISAMFGAPGDIIDEISRPESEIMIVGEIGEWRNAEYVRDAAALGRKKSLLVLGHEGSERAGMVYITEEFQKLLPEIEFKYIECGEVYSYTR